MVCFTRATISRARPASLDTAINAPALAVGAHDVGLRRKTSAHGHVAQVNRRAIYGFHRQIVSAPERLRAAIISTCIEGASLRCRWQDKVLARSPRDNVHRRQALGLQRLGISGPRYLPLLAAIGKAAPRPARWPVACE